MVDKVYSSVSLYLVLFINSGVCNVVPQISQSNQVSLIDLVMRGKRQAGYFYDRPNVAFELPARETSVAVATPTSTTAPQSQQMYYAYPVPNPGSTPNDNSIVNIGFSNTGSVASSTTVATVGSTGYNYAPQSASTNAPTSVGISSTPGTVGVSASSPTPGVTGYGYNGPSSSPSPSSVSTNAPTYLPPTAINNVTPGSSTINLSPAVSSVPTIGIPDSYLPPSSVTPTPSTLNPGSLLLQNPSTSYIPPNPSSQPPGTSPSAIASTSPASPIDSRVYLPPQENLKPDFISTPAPTYLPPLL